VKGDSYSGDNIPASTFVNAGELVLNRAQQGNLANQLEQGGGAVGGGAPYVTGETIFLGLNNYMRSHGYGELIPSRR
jgi:acyl CoA:acetate/3-ketoacid CoA transferase alpha subunit